MNWFDVILLSIVEGLTEFLPISSTGHMILVSEFLDIVGDKNVKNFEIIIQFGAILSVLAVYTKLLLQKPQLIKSLLIAFLPTAIIGFAAKDLVDRLLDSPMIVVFSLFIGGWFLVKSDLWFKNQSHTGKKLDELSVKDLLIIGTLQCLALVPGVSRSAATILAGLYRGLSFSESAAFSFLLAMPTLGGAAFLRAIKIPMHEWSEQLPHLIVGSLIAFLVALASIKVMLAFLDKTGFKFFGYYRMLLAITVGALLYIK